MQNSYAMTGFAGQDKEYGGKVASRQNGHDMYDVLLRQRRKDKDDGRLARRGRNQGGAPGLPRIEPKLAHPKRSLLPCLVSSSTLGSIR